MPAGVVRSMRSIRSAVARSACSLRPAGSTTNGLREDGDLLHRPTTTAPAASSQSAVLAPKVGSGGSSMLLHSDARNKQLNSIKTVKGRGASPATRQDSAATARVCPLV